MKSYIARIMESIDPEISQSLTDEQRKAIEEAIAQERPNQYHAVNIELPLYFARYYFVLQLGRDRRTTRRILEKRRRKLVAFAGNVMFFFMVASPLLLVFLAVIYILKSAMGIDLFPDFHMPHLFGFHD